MIDPIARGCRTVSVLSRAKGFRHADLLTDLATLAVDLESRGAMSTARRLEAEFFRRNPEWHEPRLYRFYRVAAAVRRACDLFYGESGEYSIEATACVASALRYALDLGGPFLLAIGGPEQAAGANLAESLGELTGAMRLDKNSLTLDQSHYPDLDEVVFEQLTAQAKKCLLDGIPVVVLWPLNREEERLALARIAEDLAAPYLLVKCATGFADRPANNNRREAYPDAPRRRLWESRPLPWSSDGLGRSLRQTYVEPVIAQPDLALLVLRNLAQSAS